MGGSKHHLFGYCVDGVRRLDRLSSARQMWKGNNGTEDDRARGSRVRGGGGRNKCLRRISRKRLGRKDSPGREQITTRARSPTMSPARVTRHTCRGVKPWAAMGAQRRELLDNIDDGYSTRGGGGLVHGVDGTFGFVFTRMDGASWEDEDAPSQLSTSRLLTRSTRGFAV
jgi:hypothetical protein